VLGISGIAAGLATIVLNIIEWSTPKPAGEKRHLFPKFTRKRVLNLLVVAATIVLAAGFATNWFNPYYYVTVPSATQAPPTKFMFWTELNNATDASIFNASEWQELDNHGAILSVYGLNESDNDTFAWAAFIRDAYPAIKIIWPLGGGYYNYEAIAQGTKDYLDGIRAYNLTNTIGFVYDLERDNDTCWRNAADLQASLVSFQQDFALIRAFNASYRIDVTGGYWMMLASLPLGGGQAVELYYQHPIMSLASDWTYYEWQLYRGNAVGPPSDPGSTNLFERVLTSVRIVGAAKTLPLFGMTGVGDYGPNNCTVGATNGTPCRFDQVIRDCQLSRALGVPEIGFYTLCAAGVYDGVYYPSMFQAYGEHFLDVLDTDVNQLAQPLSLVVPGNTAFQTSVGYYWEQMILAVPVVAVVLIFVAPAIVVAANLLQSKRVGKQEW
jgi:hypothetical protein